MVREALSIRVLVTPGPCLKPNARCHWGARSREARDLREAAYYATHQSGIGMLRDQPYLVWLRIAWGKGRRAQDSDNAIASCKSLLDGVAAGIGVDDRVFDIAGIEQLRDPDGLGWVDVTMEAA